MTVVRIVDPDAVRPSHVVMLCVAAVTLAGSYLLTSGPQAAVEGAKDWHEESPLRAIVHVLNLNYTQTTAQGVEIKSLVFGVGAALAVLVYGLGVAVRSRGGEEVAAEDTVISESPAPPSAAGLTRRQMPPLGAAQGLMIAYVAWSFLSTQWSSAPDLALGGSALLAVGVVWALSLGRGLNRRTAQICAVVLLVVCVLTAAMAVAYHGERNPVRRASYPIGNPLFLAACLIPGVLLAVAFLGGTVRSKARDSRVRRVAVAVLCLAANAVLLWAFRLTSARSGALAALVGLAALLSFMVPRRARLPVAAVTALLVGVIVLTAWPRFTAPSSTGRDASLRMRAYAWWYAIDMIGEAKVLGHGQGGFTQFGDAYATRDVIDAPLALGARIAHAHNEWLETCADLGPIGLTLILASLALTLVAGLRAMPALPHATWRWTLAALMASLIAIAVEECADTGLRVAGLPAVFYSVVGLIWAMSCEPGAGGSAVSRTAPTTRRLLAGGSVLLGVIVLGVSVRDFRAARAYYEVSPALRRRAFDEAIALAEQATRGRLSPQRRLEAFEGLCSAHVYIAREYQSAAVDRYNRARATQPPDERLLALAADDRKKSEAHITAARSAFDALIRRAPGFWGAGWLEFRLYQLRNVFADLDGDSGLSERITTAACTALKRELKRRPYDTELALTYVAVAGDRIELPDIIDLLARPLRHSAIPSGYVEFVSEMASDEGFDAAFVPIWNKISLVSPDSLPADPFAAEKLRLAALVRFTRDDYARAAETARMALTCYEAGAGARTTGHAACYAELGDYRFFSDPGLWREAIQDAERAIELLPRSTPGRQLAGAIRSRTVTYYLAGGDEATARRILGEVTGNRSEAFISSELGARYALLCMSLIRRDRADFPPHFSEWVGRALKLNPTNELAWRLNAQLAFDDERLDDSADSLRRALQYGADPQTVYAFVQLALTSHPDAAGFRSLSAELRAFLTGASRQDSTRPATGTSVPPATEPR